MNALKNRSLVFVVVNFGITFLLAGALAGCAKPNRGSAGGKHGAENLPLAATLNPEALKNPAEYLKLRLIPVAKANAANQDAAYPDRSVQPTEPRPSEEVIAKAEHVAFKNTLQLTGEPLFLTFSEDGFGLPIREVDLTHQRRNGLNRPEGQSRRVGALYDEPTRRWYVPMSDVLGELSEVGASELQELRIDLYFPDNSTCSVYLSFRATGPIQAIQSQFRPRANAALTSSSPAAYVQSLGNSVLLGHDELTNPTRRRIKVWVRALSGSRLAARTSLAYSYFIERAEAPPTGPHFNHHASDGVFEPNRLIARQNGAVKTLGFIENDWVSIELEPYSTVQLEWRGGATNSSLCSAPPATFRTLRWTTYTQPNCPPRIDGCQDAIPHPHSQNVTEGWNVIGASLNGTFGREIRVADPDLDGSLATAAQIPVRAASLVLSIVNSSAQITENIGTTLPGSPSSGVCQGLGWF
ncbi:MAG TPA: hypothetical protein DCS07_05435 [Bdellovibrionales bacterium]|nr:MAG: hypothetical protein A2Z97_09000 [Bdellovibrionales bacterium GWB1_52_6]OFZ06292.1 MAG: hypothetical protein A2X97_02400 [Bdellovibrionales bacterium GWA1_52_35]OFZ36136.1 MAG: hypothetical protein A2070_04410 [Bdellovibrionales bacterium GWC1_52_8]HAR42061.1 hypothetical protein [Bdellovibrionales bacterium]HCM40041.1 hypothetical protein [Bdellovibrionales bacterium]